MLEKRPDIVEAWILRVMAQPAEEPCQADERYALWGLMPEAWRQGTQGHYPLGQGNCSQRLL